MAVQMSVRLSPKQAGNLYQKAMKLETAFKAAKAFIESHAADPDLTAEMVEKYAAYQEAAADLKT